VFKELKKGFIKELGLAAPDLNKKMRIEVDVLDYAIERFYQWSTKIDNGSL